MNQECPIPIGLQGACDCHIHVFADPADFPFVESRTYTPGPAPLSALLAWHDELGIDRMVIVQASPYGTDNSCLLDVLRQCGNRARGVAVIDDDVDDVYLARIHKAGVRGVRLNLETTGDHDPISAARRLQAIARRIAPLGWHIQTYTNLTMLHALRDVIRDLPVPLVVDHFGKPDAALGPDQPGLASLLDAVASGRTYVKLSAPYRVSTAPDYQDADWLARCFIQANPDRVLWGSDWPHPGSAAGGPPSRAGITPFREEDNKAALRRAWRWLPDQEHAQKLWVTNPARLYQFE